MSNATENLLTQRAAQIRSIRIVMKEMQKDGYDFPVPRVGAVRMQLCVFKGTVLMSRPIEYDDERNDDTTRRKRQRANLVRHTALLRCAIEHSRRKRGV